MSKLPFLQCFVQVYVKWLLENVEHCGGEPEQEATIMATHE